MAKKKDVKAECKLTLGEPALNQLMWLGKELKARTLADVIRSSLSLMLRLVEEHNKGWKIMLIKGDGRKEIELG